MVTKIRADLKLTISRQNGSPIVLTVQNVIERLLGLELDPIDELKQWIQDHADNPGAILQWLKGVEVLTGLSTQPVFYQLAGTISVTPIGDLYKVVKKGGGVFWGGTPTQCWERDRAYKGSVSAQLVGHVKEFNPPIFLDVKNIATWRELINGFADYYSEFANLIRTQRPDPRSPIPNIVSIDHGPGTLVAYRQPGA